ncbi:unnamed protein product [Protopolystoma xenopodis]|uniref:Uncharacterized protein n=1 Tax=Protopolystoma xenopodis TaxID=117903 RepID=A0A3S5A3P2_9PLAT|nr:unnamed protein product [Protopolystoma xenopodis]
MLLFSSKGMPSAPSPGLNLTFGMAGPGTNLLGSAPHQNRLPAGHPAAAAAAAVAAAAAAAASGSPSLLATSSTCGNPSVHTTISACNGGSLHNNPGNCNGGNGGHNAVSTASLGARAFSLSIPGPNSCGGADWWAQVSGNHAAVSGAPPLGQISAGHT